MPTGGQRGWGRRAGGFEATGVEGKVVPSEESCRFRWPDPRLLKVSGRGRQEEVAGAEHTCSKCKPDRLWLEGRFALSLSLGNRPGWNADTLACSFITVVQAQGRGRGLRMLPPSGSGLLTWSPSKRKQQ